MNVAGAIARMRRAGAAALRPLRPWLPPRPAILMYHRIAEEPFDPWGLSVSPERFAGQLDWIARTATPLPLDRFVELHLDGRLPRNAVALTFDDGYACNAHTAAPLLEERGVAATIFLPAQLIDRGREYWWDELERIVLESRRVSLKVDGRTVAIGRQANEDRRWKAGQPPKTARQRAYRDLWFILSGMSPADLDRAMAALRRQAGTAAEPRPTHRPMNREEIDRTRSALVGFGSHALTHASLPALALEEKAEEIRLGLRKFEELTGEQATSFAYPYGHSDPESERLVREAGLNCACRADGGVLRRGSGRFALPRFPVLDWTAAELARHLGRPYARSGTAGVRN